jgi:hypothetical protein
MYKILKKNLPGTNTDDQKKFSFKKTFCIAALIKAVTASIEANHQTWIKKILSQPVAHQLTPYFPFFTSLLDS